MANWFFPGPGWRRDRGAAADSGTWLRPLPLLGLFLLAAWAFGTTFWLGRIGFMSLDMPITWDAAWRMMHGQVPCRDFNAPGDVIPALIQILFFKVCGTTWWGYLAHAGLCNAAFALGVTLFLSRMGAPLFLALFVGAMEGWHFNTPIGIPYYDQYSYFFSLFALMAATLGMTEEARWARLFWLAWVPPLCLAAALSKVSPGFYVLALLPGIFLFGSRRRERWEAAGMLAASALLTAAFFVLVCWVEKITPGRMWESFFGLPSGIGHERWAAVDWADWRAQLVWRLGRLPGLWVALPAAGLALAAFFLRRGMARKEDRSAGPRLHVLIWLTLALPWADLVTFLSADQQALNYLACGVLALGTGLTALGLAAGSGRVARMAYAGAFAVMLAATARVEAGTAWKMVLRDVNDFGLPQATKVADLPPAGRELRPMRWVNSSGVYSAEEFWQVVDFLREKREPFFIAGQNTLPYALCGEVNPFPAAWLHPGLTFPKSDDPRRPAFDAWAIARLKAAGIRWMVVDPTWGDWLSEFPFLKAWAEQATGPEVDISSWRLIPVDPSLLP